MLLDAETLDLLPAPPRCSSAAAGPALQARAGRDPAGDRAAAVAHGRRERGGAGRRPPRPRRGRARHRRPRGDGRAPVRRSAGQITAPSAIGRSHASTGRWPRRSRSVPCRSMSRFPATSGRSASTTRCAPTCRAGRTGGQRAVLRRARQRARLRPPEGGGPAAAPRRAAGDRELGGVRRRPALGRDGQRAPGHRPLVVGAAPAPRPRHAGAARARRTGHGEGRRRCGRVRTVARPLARDRPRRRRAAAPGPHVADRGEPLAGVPPRARRKDVAPARRLGHARARAAARARRDAAPSAASSAARPSSSTSPGCSRPTAPSASAPRAAPSARRDARPGLRPG